MGSVAIFCAYVLSLSGKKLRAYPGTLRGTPEWDSIYKIRVNVENQSTISRAAFVLPVAKPETKKLCTLIYCLPGLHSLLP